MSKILFCTLTRRVLPFGTNNFVLFFFFLSHICGMWLPCPSIFLIMELPSPFTPYICLRAESLFVHPEASSMLRYILGAKELWYAHNSQFSSYCLFSDLLLRVSSSISV